MTLTSSGPSSSSRQRRSSTSTVIDVSTSSRTERPKRVRCCNTTSIALEQVLGLVGELEVGVAGDPEHRVSEHLHAREQRVEVRGDHLLERDEPFAVGQRDEARQQRRDLDAREQVFAERGVADADREVQREVRDVGEGVRRVDGERCEHGEDALVEHLAQLRTVGRVEVVPAHEANVARVRARARRPS